MIFPHDPLEVGPPGCPVLPKPPAVERRPEGFDAIRGTEVSVFVVGNPVSVPEELLEVVVRLPAIRDDETARRDVIEKKPICGLLFPIGHETERNPSWRGPQERAEDPALSAVLLMSHAGLIDFHDALERARCSGKVGPESREKTAHALRGNARELRHLPWCIPVLPAPEERPEHAWGESKPLEPGTGIQRELPPAVRTVIPSAARADTDRPAPGTAGTTIGPDAGPEEGSCLRCGGWMGDGVHTESMKNRERTVALAVPSE